MTDPAPADLVRMESVRRWIDDLLSAAVLGTDRRPPPDAPASVLPSGGSILDQAAVAAALRYAGRMPTTATPTAPAPPEESPLPPTRAIELLGVLLDAAPVTRELRTNLICRWLDLAAGHGTRVPPQQLSALIALAGVQPRVLPSLQRAWGRRGDWLAEQSPASAPNRPARLDPADLAEAWDGLRTADAVAALVALRATDPDGARSIAVAHWSGLPADLKAETLRGWIVGLSDADEDFLEAALDERSVRVRTAARATLRRLPNSAFAHRMAARLRPLVTVDCPRLLLGAARMTVLAPTELDREAARDGLPGVESAADRAASLRAIASAAPLSAWCTVTGLEIGRIVSAVRDDESLVSSLITAAADQHNADWARALLAVQRSGALLATLPRDERDAYLLRALPTANDAAFRELLALADRPWSPAIARAALDRVTRPQPAGARKRASNNLVTDASVFDPDSVPHIRELLARAELPGTDVEIPDQLRRVLTAAVTYASFDRSIQEAFS